MECIHNDSDGFKEQRIKTSRGYESHEVTFNSCRSSLVL